MNGNNISLQLSNFLISSISISKQYQLSTMNKLLSIVFAAILIISTFMSSTVSADGDSIIFGHGGGHGHCHEHHGHHGHHGIIVKDKRKTIVLGHHGKNIIAEKDDKIIW